MNIAQLDMKIIGSPKIWWKYSYCNIPGRHKNINYPLKIKCQGKGTESNYIHQQYKLISKILKNLFTHITQEMIFSNMHGNSFYHYTINENIKHLLINYM